MTEADKPMPMANRKLFLLDNTWKTLDDGMDSVNRSIALEFKKFENVEVFCSVLLHKDNELSTEDIEDAKNNDVTLVYTENYDVMFPDYNYMTEAFNQDPFPYLPNICKDLQGITHIISHWPYTVQAGFLIRDIVYPDAEVILVLHVIPEELQWLEADVPYSICPYEDLIRQAEESDHVFSFTQRVFNHFESIFRKEGQRKIDHNLLTPEGHKELFGLKQIIDSDDVPTILALTYGNDSFRYDGLDIAACAINRVAEKLQNTRPFAVRFAVGIYGETAVTSEIKKMVKGYIKNAFVIVEYHHYDNVMHLMEDLAKCTLVLSPTRCEPFGSPLVHILSSGVPTLVSSNSLMSTGLKKLVNYTRDFLVPVTNNMVAVQQDASIWRDRIIKMLDDLEVAKGNAVHLQMTLKRDEGSKATMDHLKALVLGGIGFQVQVLSVEKLTMSSGFKQRRDVEQSLFLILRHCTRLKHHPLATEEDLEGIFPDSYQNIPFSNILDNVIDLIEGWGRRIVKFDEKTRQLIVFCPTLEALTDLWASCDVINTALENILTADKSILEVLDAKTIKTRVFISGPEFLKYKKSFLPKNTEAEEMDEDYQTSDDEENMYWTRLRNQFCLQRK